MNVASLRWLLIVVTKIINFVDANWITGNLCWSMPCMNGGSCFGSAYTYLCVCPINYSGALCEKPLGICQESPCGNRGLCVETGLTSFECRCYFDYVGPLCEEHVPKNDPSVWSSLIPVHTRVLFDIIQEAYRAKAHGKAGIGSNNGQIDFIGLLTANVASLSATTSSTKLGSSFITRQSETTEAENVLQAEKIQREKIFPEITASTSDMYTQDPKAQNSQTIQPNEYNNETIFSTYLKTNMTSTMMTISLEHNKTSSLNIKEDQKSANITGQFNTIITSTPVGWSSYNSDYNTIAYTREMIQNSTEEISHNTKSEEFVMNTTFQTDNNQFNSSEQTITSTINRTDQSLTIDKSINKVNITQTAHNQLLYKLCQQLLSHILPNVSSLSSSAAVEAALSLTAGSPSTGNNSADALLTWIKEQLRSSTSRTTPSTSSSSVPSLLINEKQLSSISLKRVDMDDIFHQMNANIDGEH